MLTAIAQVKLIPRERPWWDETRETFGEFGVYFAIAFAAVCVIAGLWSSK